MRKHNYVLAFRYYFFQLPAVVLKKLFKAPQKLLRLGPVGFLKLLSARVRKKNYDRHCAAKAAEAAARQRAAASPSGQAPSQKWVTDWSHFSVLFITEIDVQLSKRYRVDNICEQLTKQGIKTSILYEVEIFDHLEEALTFDIIVFQRMPMDPGIQCLLTLARERGIALVFEIDDFVFDSSVYLSQDSFKSAPAAEIAYFKSLSLRLHETLQACDYFIGTTSVLAKTAENLGHKSYVIRNGLNDRQVALAEQALRQRRRSDGAIRVGYQPGTRTHRQDFAVAVPAVVRLLAECPQVKLVIQGPLELPEPLRPFAKRIERWRYVSWQKLVAVTARLDITIAPLEPDNLLNEAKSALKYFEPGLVEVPVVASPTEDFRAAIRHGINGFLAATPEEWYESLHSLVSDASLRTQVGQAARQDSLACYTSTAQSANTLAVFQDVLRNHVTREGVVTC